jgi:Flp pilus assembly pilin Flp
MIAYLQSVLNEQRKKKDRGASAVEYALIMGLVVAVLITILLTFGPRIQAQLNNACTRINGGTTCIS